MSTIKKEIKQKTFESPQQEAVIALLLTADKLKSKLAELSLEFGITPQQYNVLRILNGAGPEGLPTLEVMNRMIEKNPGITRLLKRITEKGLMKRKRPSADRRFQMCIITEDGKELLRKMEEPIRTLTRDVMMYLHEEDIEQLLDLMYRARKGM